MVSEHQHLIQLLKVQPIGHTELVASEGRGDLALQYQGGELFLGGLDEVWWESEHRLLRSGGGM